MMRVLSGDAPPGSQNGLKVSLVQRGYFLACSARPETDLAVGPAADDDVSVAGKIVEIEPLSESVSRVRIQLDGEFEFRAGQFVNLVRADGLVRSYSVANLPNGGGELEMHVREIAGGRMSGWLCRGDALGEAIHVRGPAGDCFYIGDADEELLLAGTGLAPLLGIIRNAVQAGHCGKVTVYHGALDERGLYLTEELRDLESTWKFLSYHACVLRGEPRAGLLVGALDEVVLNRHPELDKARIYLCGDPDLVNNLRRKLYIAGADLKRIHADAFLSTPS